MRGSGTRKVVAAVAIVALALGAPTLAAASGHHHGTKSSTSAAAKAYAAEVAAIDRQFVTAVNRAKAALSAALASAKSAAQRSTARVQYSLAIDQAVQVREEALAALGPAPTTSDSARVAATLAPRVGV